MDNAQNITQYLESVGFKISNKESRGLLAIYYSEALNEQIGIFYDKQALYIKVETSCNDYLQTIINHQFVADLEDLKHLFANNRYIARFNLGHQ